MEEEGGGRGGLFGGLEKRRVERGKWEEKRRVEEEKREVVRKVEERERTVSSEKPLLFFCLMGGGEGRVEWEGRGNEH